MDEKRMLIMPAELVKRIDENRGDMGQAEFIDYLIDRPLKETKEKKSKEPEYVTREEINAFQKDMKQLLKSFLDFFVNYGLELGSSSPMSELQELTSKIQGLQKDLDPDGEEGKVTIKWK